MITRPIDLSQFSEADSKSQSDSNRELSKNPRVIVIGAGMAGTEAAWMLANHGIEVLLFESKRIKATDAQKSLHFAELVCTNSLKSLDPMSAHGLLKEEMEQLGSLILKQAKIFAVPAGQALAVDREPFAASITKLLEDHPRIKIIDEIVINPSELLQKYDAAFAIVATGPLTHEGLTTWMQKEISGEENLYFYDAIAPVVDGDSLDYSKLYFKDRHLDPALSADYLNAPFHDKADYEKFMHALAEAPRVDLKSFESPIYFEACLPIDEMARRGIHTARFSCMKPIGLDQPGIRTPYAVVQLRKENLKGTSFNMVGFQTRLTYGAQLEVFRMIPGFENAQFLKLGSIHRNTYLHAKKTLNDDMSSKKLPRIYFAGQMTGVEGYTESAASGLFAAIEVLRQLFQKSDDERYSLTSKTMMGALISAIRQMDKPVPTNANFGLFESPSIPVELLKQKGGIDRKKYRKEIIIGEARMAFKSWYSYWQKIT
ncbi:MAG: methylenetetrahydrofolate--tRNA-(uracil(54)-C(5))-methyltransferase (FADH(2)-oxidizing) TrmFO [Bacteriovoracaceae bacterium]|nr:methylenetetrahydrofolate--tRNA-(uracil(54)-C(5))-methyltransferase (FADH(2)-oxidizing) TrmFO [Bacteriovoracaceae bacterium]